MTRARRMKAARDLIAQFIENVNADAVVVCWSETRNNRTFSWHACHGNGYACQGLAGRLFESLTEDDEDSSDTESGEDETDNGKGKSEA